MGNRPSIYISGTIAFNATLGGTAINDVGTVAFIAGLDAGGSGIFTGPDPVGASAIDPEALNNNGDIAFRYGLANGVQGVAVAVKDGAGADPADLDGDGTVDVQDMLLLLGAWGPCPDYNDCPADLNSDCSVDVQDLLLLLGAWGA